MRCTHLNSALSFLGVTLEILSVVSTLFAVWFGYWLSNSKRERQIQNIKGSLYSELKLIEEEFLSWYTTALLNEYEAPERTDFSYPVDIDWDYFNSLQLNLGENVLPEHRRLFKRIKTYEESIKINSKNRNEKATQSDGSVVFVDYQLTAQIIVQVNQIIYFVTKALSEKESFIMSSNYNMEDVMLSVRASHKCEVTNEQIERILRITQSK